MPCSLGHRGRRFVGPCGGIGGGWCRAGVCTDPSQIEDVAISSIARLNGANNAKDEEG